ncbi:MAG: helix-hairpin-helix domain-containing protein [Chloroflexi bacterium]|nr:helix-hairpin-helix domain-containing protein [Chloroflexota bacterium]
MTIGDRIAVASLATALVAVALGAWLLLATGAAPATADGSLDFFSEPSGSAIAVLSEALVVDVEGAVLRPGIIQLPTGSRVADAIEAAGGYGPHVDLAAAATQVNLAAVLRDGQQIVVPLVGAATAGGSGNGGAGGLVDLNTASPEALDALPGIGPVTVQKIVAARSEQPFGSLEEMVTRKVLTNAQVDKIRDLVTLG